jgi:hypothetical protein
VSRSHVVSLLALLYDPDAVHRLAFAVLILVIRIERDILFRRVLIILELGFIDHLPLFIIILDDLLSRRPIEIKIVNVVLNPLLLYLPRHKDSIPPLLAALGRCLLAALVLPQSVEHAPRLEVVVDICSLHILLVGLRGTLFWNC